MTPEQKAREIAALWVKAGQIFTSKTLGEASDLLDAALREARNAALEEAAAVAKETYTGSNGKHTAARILALKDKQE